jgi:hypothetical protein
MNVSSLRNFIIKQNLSLSEIRFKKSKIFAKIKLKKTVKAIIYLKNKEFFPCN